MGHGWAYPTWQETPQRLRRAWPFCLLLCLGGDVFLIQAWGMNPDSNTTTVILVIEALPSPNCGENVARTTLPFVQFVFKPFFPRHVGIFKYLFSPLFCVS